MHLAFRTGTYISLILLNVVAATRPMVFQSNAKAGKPDQLTSSSAVTPVYLARVVDVYPHDPSAFTEGLVFQDGFLYEGTGLNGKSTLRRVDLATGQVLQSHALPFQYFGEGITIYGDRIIQLTWTTQVGFAYDKDSFALQQIFSYGTQGWGITHDETRLIMSDGTSTLHFWDPDTFAELGQLAVYDDRGPVTGLNELEYVQGRIYANVWLTDRIAIIDPQSGQVAAWINLVGLLDPEDGGQAAGVLNGIAYDPDEDRLFITGKYWPKLFQIELATPRLLFLPLVQNQMSHQPVSPDGSNG